MWDREHLIAASVLLFVIAITNITFVGLMTKNVAQRGNAMKSEQKKLYW